MSDLDWDSEAGRAVIEAATKALNDRHKASWFVQPGSDSRAVLAAAVAARVPCPTCGGDGAAGTHPHAVEEGDPCLDCVDGTVPALALLLGGER